MIYIITTETFPNGLAATQRIKCYAKSIVALGYPCKVLCLNRCEDPSNPLGNTQAKGKLDGYEYSYIGGSTLIKKTWQNKINQLADTFRLVLMMLFSFGKADKVIVYSYNSTLLKLVEECSRIKGFNVYFELNEHPSVLRSIFGVDGETTQDLELIKRRLKGIEGTLCISDSLKDLLIRAGIPEEKTFVVNMLVDSSRFDGIVKQESEPYIGYCGAADNNKDGVDRLIKAFSQIANEYQDLKLYIMGPKRGDCENESLAKKLGIADRVVFTGMISPDKMPQMLVNAKVLALARPQSIQAKYGFPTKLGEYLSTGNPVVVTSVGDIPLFLKDGESAYLAEPDNIEAFARCLDRAISDKNAKTVGDNGRDVAKTWFCEERVKAQLKIALNLE